MSSGCTIIAKIIFSMTNSKVLFRELHQQIRIDEPDEEIQNIVFRLLEGRWGVTRTQVLAEKKINNVPGDELQGLIERINNHEPIQYITGRADFYGRVFQVNPAVLIPRPETELLVDECLEVFSRSKKGKILDVGTGSGCIAITLAKELRDAEIFASDISQQALMVAEANARLHGVQVNFEKQDILSETLPWRELDVLVSNPPYILPTEKLRMKKNVLLYEPSTALFVPQDNGLLFYKALAHRGKEALKKGGALIVEINEAFGDEVSTLFRTQGYHQVQMKKDLSGKDRVISARTDF
jgi:release factor glutamine methyltransferase